MSEMKLSRPLKKGDRVKVVTGGFVGKELMVTYTYDDQVVLSLEDGRDFCRASQAECAVMCTFLYPLGEAAQPHTHPTDEDIAMGAPRGCRRCDDERAAAPATPAEPEIDFDRVIHVASELYEGEGGNGPKAARRAIGHANKIADCFPEGDVDRAFWREVAASIEAVESDFVDEAPSLADEARVSATTVNACACCKTSYNAAGWNALAYLGRVPSEKEDGTPCTLEMRNCVCGSTLGVES